MLFKKKIIYIFIYFNCGHLYSKYILTPNQNTVSLILSNNLINDNSIQKLNINNYNYDDMDETDLILSTKKSFVSGNNEKRASRVFCCGDPLNVKSLLSRPGGAVQIITNKTGTHTIQRNRGGHGDAVGGGSRNNVDHNDDDDDNDEVGECKLSTIQLSPTELITKSKIEYLSDNHLDKIGAGSCFETLSEDGCSGGVMPSTSARTQNDLIQFVFTSHGIRVISDKEYVV